MRKLHKKYSKPKRLFDYSRLAQEKKLKAQYGLKNMRELWIAKEFLRRVRSQARKLLSLPKDIQEEKAKILIDKLNKYGILKQNAVIDDILSLQVEDILKRRLQTLVYAKNLASTIKQARQLIVHGHIMVGDHKVTSPGALISVEEENLIFKVSKHEKSNS